MKVICNRGALLEALTIAGNVIAARTPKPVLQCVRLAAADNELLVSATDLEVAIVYRENQVEIGEAGEVVVPADKLRDIVRESTDDVLTVELVGDMLHVKGQDSFFKVFTQPAEGFPQVPGFGAARSFEIGGAQLRRLISQTVFSAAQEASRYALNGVLLNVKGKRVTFVGTDGRRLAEAQGDLVSGGGSKTGPKAIIPTKALTLMEKIIDDPEEPVGFEISENRITAQTARACLTSTLIEGEFPPFEDVIPRDTDKKAFAGTADLLSAARRASLLTNEENKGLRMSFSKKGLVLSSQSPNDGEATVNFPCKYEGADMDIGFNPGFLIEALRVVDSEDVTLEMSNPNRPGLLRGGPNFLYVIMPVSLS
jgi:DNA polymerase III subunit beta